MQRRFVELKISTPESVNITSSGPLPHDGRMKLEESMQLLSVNGAGFPRAFSNFETLTKSAEPSSRTGMMTSLCSTYGIRRTIRLEIGTTLKNEPEAGVLDRVGL